MKTAKWHQLELFSLPYISQNSYIHAQPHQPAVWWYIAASLGDFQHWYLHDTSTNVCNGEKCILLLCAWNTVHGKILVGENWAICLTSIHWFKENLYGIWIDCCLFTKFSLTNSLYLHGSPKFSPAKYFLCMVRVFSDPVTNEVFTWDHVYILYCTWRRLYSCIDKFKLFWIGWPCHLKSCWSKWSDIAGEVRW